VVRHVFIERVCPVCGATKLVRDYEPWCCQPPRRVLAHVPYADKDPDLAWAQSIAREVLRHIHDSPDDEEAAKYQQLYGRVGEIYSELAQKAQNNATKLPRFVDGADIVFALRRLIEGQSFAEYLHNEGHTTAAIAVLEKALHDVQPIFEELANCPDSDADDEDVILKHIKEVVE